MSLSSTELAVLEEYLGQLQQGYVRGIVWCTGDQHWVEQTASQIIAAQSTNCVWVGTGAPDGVSAIEAKQGRSFIGQTQQLIVYNAYSGLHPDSFAALVGTLQGGGLLMLLSPEPEQWQHFADPDYQRMIPHGFDAQQYSFNQRLAGLLQASNAVCKISQSSGVSSINVSYPAVNQSKDFVLTVDQEAALAAIKRSAAGRAKRPLVITANRGRGKSTVLGVAAAQLMQEKECRIIVCAPDKSAAVEVFAYAKQELGLAATSESITFGDSSLGFYPPDELLRQQPSADVLLVDEAAAIPTPMLAAMVEQYGRVIFASTVHGYEGHGRGFAIRFTGFLSEAYPQWRCVTLTEPVRWSSQDEVEPLLAEMLLLNCEPAAEVADGAVTYQQLRSADLLADETLLHQLFGLLVQAHYRTSPDDLRLLLDGPHCRVCVAMVGNSIVAAALLAEEGIADAELHTAISQGHRRLSGHLVPQMLASQAGMTTVLPLQCWRVMRIAVLPNNRRQQLGSNLLRFVQEQAQQQQVDYVATSFAAAKDVLPFWQANGFTVQHIGWRRDSVSGSYNVVMAKPLSAEAAPLFSQQQNKIVDSLPVLLAAHLQNMDAALVVQMVKQFPQCSVRSSDLQIIDLFVQHNLLFENALPHLHQTAMAAIQCCEGETQAELIVQLVLQHHSWQQLSQQGQYSGKASIVSALQKAYKCLTSDE